MLDEKFYNAVKKMIEEEGDLPNAIHRLIDDDKYNALPYESRERYVLEVANKYREAKERYYKERENKQRKKQEEDFRRQEEERKRVEQEKLKLEETKRKEKIRRKEEAKRKREEGIRRLQFEHGAVGSEVNEKRNKFAKQSNSEGLFTKYSGCSETVNFVNNIEREEKEKLSKIFGNSSPGFENKFINNSGLGLDSLFCRFDSIIFLDTETTGLDSRNDRLIELAAIKVVREECNLQIAREMDSFIKLPEGMKLDKQIIELTGITNEDLLFKGKESKFVFQQFATMLAEEKTLLVAYNAQFDLNFIYWGLFNKLQNAVLSKFYDGSIHFTFVGDDDQTIYTWRGADNSIIKQMAVNPRVNTVYLTTNYRSNPYIVNAGNDILQSLDDTVTWGDVWETLTTPLPQDKGIDRSSKVDPDDWEYHDNCSDREYEDDEDYDDFDN